MMKRGSIYIGLVEHLGDIVACEPVARYVKALHPDKEIVWVSSPLYSELITSNPNIDRFMPAECLTDWMRIIKHTQSSEPVIDLHVNYRVCEQCRIPLVKTSGNPSVNIHNWYNYGSLLEAFSFGAGLPRLSDAPRVYIQDSNVQHVDSLSLPEAFITIHRCSNDKARDWSDEKWLTLLDLLAKTGLSIVEIGTPPKSENPVPPCCERYLDLRGKTSFLDVAEILRRSALFIGIDSGPAHIANAVECPAVILLGSFGNFRRHMPYSGFFASDTPAVKLVRNPVGPAREISVRSVHDAVCYVLNRPEDVTHLATIPVSSTPLATSKVKDCDLPEARDPDVKVLAFYLPQFHPLPENDMAWGDGFTEWTNIIHAQPLFRGHTQPVEPGELGYYDLRSTDVLRDQARLAKEHNVSGFCFYYYYFSGKHVLNTPLDHLMASEIEMPFSLIWANHNWTKKWDAGNSQVIIDQVHSDFDDKYFINSVFEYFRDPRYIKVDGKPLLGIFMPHLFPDIRKTTDLWRDEAAKNGFDGLYLYMVDDWEAPINCPEEFGFDATYEMPSNTLGHLRDHREEVELLRDDFVGKILDYDELADRYIFRPFPSYKRLKTVMAPWDNTPRYKERASVCRTHGLDAYKKWLTHACIDTYRHHAGQERIVFLHSWNEWAEGTYIEPSAHEGRKRLIATRDGIADARKVIDMVRRTKSPLEFDPELIEYFLYMNKLEEYAFRAVPLEKNDAAVNRLNAEVNQLKNEMQTLLNSRSMRATKLLRYLSGKLQSFRQTRR